MSITLLNSVLLADRASEKLFVSCILYLVRYLVPCVSFLLSVVAFRHFANRMQIEFVDVVAGSCDVFASAAWPAQLLLSSACH